MKFKRKLLIGLILILLGTSIFNFYWHQRLPLVSPVDLIESLAPIPIFHQPSAKVVFGFLPYWNLNDLSSTSIKPLTHLAYFGVDLAADGTVTKTITDEDNIRTIEPGWAKLDSAALKSILDQAKLLGKKTILTIKSFDSEKMESILNTPKNRQQAVLTSVELAKSYRYQGINIDFEHPGGPDTTTKENFVLFVQELSRLCRKEIPDCEISVDTYAESGKRSGLYDLDRISQIADYVFVMAYDFYRRGSTNAGPVSPLRGKCPELATTTPCLDYDIVNAVSDINKLVPAHKIILGFPFYGYQWQTASTNFLANTYPKTGQTVTYENLKEMFYNPQISSLKSEWSDISQTPYLTFGKDGEYYQIHYEDARSLSLKIDLINQSGLAGLGIWALGYEHPYTDLWQVIRQKL